MDEKHVGTELKAALSDLRQLATQLAGASREWWDNRRQDMNPYDKQQDSRREAARRRERDTTRGYGEGYATAGVQGRPREEDWEDTGNYGGDAEPSRWGRGRESDGDVRSQYGGGGRDTGGWSQRHGGRERSGFSEYASGSREYGRAFDDSDLGRGSRYGDRESGYYAREGGDYSQGYGRERDPGRIYGPEDFSQRYEQGDVFGGGGYGEEGRSASSDRTQGGSWRDRGGSRDFHGGGSSGGGMSGRGQEYGSSGRGQNFGGSGRTQDFGSSSRGQDFGSSGQYGSGTSHRGRGPRGYSRSDERIAEDLNERLTDDHHIDASELQVSVSGGVVTLSGTVEQRWMKHRAEDLAESCSGVNDVRNEIRVQSSGKSQESASQGYGASERAGSRSSRGTSSASGTSTSSRGSASGSSAGGSSNTTTGTGSTSTDPTGTGSSGSTH